MNGPIFVKISRNALITGYREPKKPAKERSFKFTPHRQEIGNKKIFRHRIVISKNVSRFIFGDKYERIAKYVVHESRSVIVINIASSELLNSIFSLEKLSAFGFWRGDVAYHGCGKVHLEYCDGSDGEIEGYITKEKETSKKGKMKLGTYTSKWTIRDSEDREFRIDAPTYDPETKKYVFKESFRVKGRKMQVCMNEDDPEYEPIRIMIHKLGVPKITFFMNRLCVHHQGRKEQHIDTALSS